MGTPDFAVLPLKAIIAAGHQVLAAVTQPDKQKGRGREIKFSPVKEYAAGLNIPVLQPVKIKDSEAIAELKNLNADIFVVFAYGQILSEEVLNLSPHGCINIHASLLPLYRGAAPIQRAVIDGVKESGVTIIQMDKGIDTGDMLLKSKITLAPKETSDTLHEKLSVLGSTLVTEALNKIEKGTIKRTKQNDADSSYAPMLKREEALINWEMPAAKIERLIRGLNSRPGAYTYYNNKTLKIWASDLEPGSGEDTQKNPPGTITEITKNSIKIACGKGLLSITELQPEGKKKMQVKDFLLGNKVKTGELLLNVSS